MCGELPPVHSRNPSHCFTNTVRGLAAGFAIAIGVLLSLLDPIAGGVASTFPAIVLTVVVSLHLSQPDGVVLGALGPMMLGVFSVTIYVILFAYLFIPFYRLIGDPWGALAIDVLISYLASIVTISLPAGLFLQWINKWNFSNSQGGVDDYTRIEPAREDASEIEAPADKPNSSPSSGR